MPETAVSLPIHLRRKLLDLQDILPTNLLSKLSPFLSESVSDIPHSILLDISKWARTDEARLQLRVKLLDYNDYTIISLLAGTITSPSSKFPSYIPPPDPAEQARRALDDRKAISAILNGVLSMGCVGYAGWWAGGSSGWRDEWRALFAIFVALVVGIAEAGLYLIWQSRKGEPRKMRRIRVTRKKKDDVGEVIVEEEVITLNGNLPVLRKRHAQAPEEKTEG